MYDVEKRTAVLENAPSLTRYWGMLIHWGSKLRVRVGMPPALRS